MEFNSITHALHYASGCKREILIVDNSVIDITEFKHSHPGGEESINKFIGKDCTEYYYKISSHKTSTAIKELFNFTIGKIKTESNNSKTSNINQKPIVNDIQDCDKNYSIDLKQGTIYQVFKKLNKEQYLGFIHDPKHMIDPPDAIMFDTPFLEFFTKTPWYAIPTIWIPVIIYNLYLSYFVNNIQINQIIISFIVGIILWTLLEYILHRFVFHIDDNLPDNSYALLTHYLLHGIHHAFPMDRYRLVFPPAAGVVVYKLFTLAFNCIFDVFAPAFIAGTVLGYIGYDLTHFFIHHVNPPLDYHKFLKKYHVLHHYKEPHLGYGVSNHFWDKVFGTVLINRY